MSPLFCDALFLIIGKRVIDQRVTGVMSDSSKMKADLATESASGVIADSLIPNVCLDSTLKSMTVHFRPSGG